MSNIQLLRETASVAVLANTAISAVIEGEIDPITAHINISKMENAIKAFKANDHVRDITLKALSRYGRKLTFGDCILEEVEAGVKYDYAKCGDSELEELYKMRQTLDESIKQREAFLKTIPIAGIVIPETGELVYPPAKTSKTTIKTTFKKQ